MEMYIISILHGGKVQMNPAAKTVSLQTAMKQFKKRVRNVALHCTAKEDEWHFSTCQGRGNRLEELAIANRHVAIKGMPQLSEGDANRVTAAILAMRGVNQNKHRNKFTRMATSDCIEGLLHTKGYPELG